MDRDIREKSQSDERSIIHGHSSGGGGQWGKGKPNTTKTQPVVSIEVELSPHSNLTEVLREADASGELTSLGYQIRPKFGQRFSPETTRSLVKIVIEEFFQNQQKQSKSKQIQYDHDSAQRWSEVLTKEILERVKKSCILPKYKLVGHCVIGEVIGGGVHVGMKCCWDVDTDSYASYSYLGDNFFCVATICGIYCY